MASYLSPVQKWYTMNDKSKVIQYLFFYKVLSSKSELHKNNNERWKWRVLLIVVFFFLRTVLLYYHISSIKLGTYKVKK